MAVTVSYGSSIETIDQIRARMPMFYRGESNLTLRNRGLIALMRQWGGIEANAVMGIARVWDVLYDLPQTTPWIPGVDLSFQPKQVLAQFILNTPGKYKNTDVMYHHDIVDLQSEPTRIVDRYSKKSTWMVNSLRNNFNRAILYGDPSIRPSDMSGFRTFLVSDNATAPDLVAKPNDTYMTQSTTPGVGSSWSTGTAKSPKDGTAVSPNASLATDWPLGREIGGQGRYDFASPINPNIASTNWASGTLWEHNCEEILRWTMCHKKNLTGRYREDSSVPQVFLADEESGRKTKQYFADRNYNLTPVQSMQQFGIPGDYLNFEGSWIGTDHDVDQGHIFHIDPEQLEFFTPYSDLFRSDGPTWQQWAQAAFYLSDMYGDFRFQPKFHGLIADWTSNPFANS